jgi:hypothetical protein
MIFEVKHKPALKWFISLRKFETGYFINHSHFTYSLYETANKRQKQCDTRRQSTTHREVACEPASIQVVVEHCVLNETSAARICNGDLT